MDLAEPLERATALLSTTLYCRKQARALQKCQAEAGGNCTQCEAAFVTCSKEHIGLVVQHLSQIAERFCPAEVDAVSRCRTLRPGATCEEEDLAAMQCAAMRVLAAAHAPKD
jgi:hypothetical protein